MFFRLVASLPFFFCVIVQLAAAETKVVDLEPIDANRNREVPVRVYLPVERDAKPVILFSHGLGGSRINNAYLATYWCEAGYVCVFMQHHGSDTDVLREAKPLQRRQALLDAVGPQTFIDRNADVSFVINQLEAWNKDSESPLYRRCDLDHIGMCGHSYGAVTTISVADRKFPLGKSFHEPRIDAFFAMSPQTSEGMKASEAFGSIRSPVLCMTGTQDDSPINSKLTPESRREVYNAMPPGDKYQLVFEGGQHYTFSDVPGLRKQDRQSNHHAAIQKVSLSFWNAYLKGLPEEKAWLQSSSVRTDCSLAEKDVWEWK